MIFIQMARARRRLENVDDELLSFRLDSEYEVGGDFITAYKVGGRYAMRERIGDDGIDTTISGLNGYDSEGAIAARRDVFPVENLLTGDRDAGLPTGSTLDFNDANIQEDTLAFYQHRTASGLSQLRRMDLKLMLKQMTSGMSCRLLTLSLNSVKINFCVLQPIGPSHALIRAHSLQA